MKEFAVAGRINLDTFARTQNLQQPGAETHGEVKNFRGERESPGGKGLNLATVISRLGGRVSLIGKIGLDPAGETLLKFLKAEEINVKGVSRSTTPSGTAKILVDEKGQRNIVTAPGCNDEITPSYIQEHADLIKHADIALTQCGIPLDAAEKFLSIAKQLGKTTILNPAPVAEDADKKLFQYVDYLVVNEDELSFYAHTNTRLAITDGPTITACAKELLLTGPKAIIVTLGPGGVIVVSNDAIFSVEAEDAHAIDATGAGDCFVGAFAVKIAEGFDLQQSVEFANKAAARSVQKEGASSSFPYLHELNDLKPKLLYDNKVNK